MKSSKPKQDKNNVKYLISTPLLRIFTLGKHRLDKEIKFATKGSLQTEMNISHSNHDVIFFINFKSGTINKSRELKFSNPFK